MALAKVLSCAVIGLDGELIDVEVDIAQGMPAFTTIAATSGRDWESDELAPLDSDDPDGFRDALESDRTRL